MKISVLIFTLLGISFLFQNCSKNSSVFEKNNDIFETKTYLKSEPWGIHTHLITDFPEFGDIWCGFPPIDCFDDVVITANSATYTVYMQLVSAWNNDTIPSFFENCNYETVFPGLTTQTVIDIIDEKLLLIMRESTKDLTTEIWIILDGDSDVNDFDVEEDVVYAMPLKFVN